jgi:hypothetical protein
VFSLESGHFIALILPAHSGNFETQTYLGLPVLVLAFVALLAEPRKHTFWIALIVLAGLYALGANGPLWPLLVRLEPGLLWFRVPSRAWFAVALIVSILAGYGLQHLILMVERIPTAAPTIWLKRLQIASLAGLWTVLICGSAAWFFLPIPRTVALNVLLWGGLSGIIMLAALSGRLKPQMFALALIGLTFADLAWTGRNWLEWRSEDKWLVPHRALAERLLAEEPERIYSPTYSLEQQAAAAYHLRLFGGVDPFQLRGVVQAIAQGSGVASQEYSVVLPPLAGVESDDEIAQANRQAIPDTEVLAAWDVSHVVAAYPLEHDRLRLLDTVDGNYIYSNLDFAPSISPDRVPDWPAGWPDLPGATIVEQNNRLTIVATLVSGVSLLLCVAMLLILKLKAELR